MTALVTRDNCWRVTCMCTSVNGGTWQSGFVRRLGTRVTLRRPNGAPANAAQLTRPTPTTCGVDTTN